MFVVPDYFHQNAEDKILLKTNDLEIVRYHNNEKHFTSEVALEKNLLLFVKSGHKHVKIYNEYTIVPENHAILIPKGSYVMTEIADQQSSFFKSFMVLISDELLVEIAQHAGLIESQKNKNPIPSSIVTWQLFEQTPFITSMLEFLDTYFVHPEKVQVSFLKVKLQELFLYLADTECAGHLKTLIQYISNKHRNMTLKQYMEQNYMQLWAIEDFSENFSLSLSTFKREFKRTFDESPRKWIINRRLAEAAPKLTQTNDSLTDIALSLGFADSSQFSKLFKNKYKCSPSEFRKAKLTNNLDYKDKTKIAKTA